MKRLASSPFSLFRLIAILTLTSLLFALFSHRYMHYHNSRMRYSEAERNAKRAHCSYGIYGDTSSEMGEGFTREVKGELVDVTQEQGADGAAGWRYIHDKRNDENPDVSKGMAWKFAIHMPSKPEERVSVSWPPPPLPFALMQPLGRPRDAHTFLLALSSSPPLFTHRRSRAKPARSSPGSFLSRQHAVGRQDGAAA